MQKNMKNMKKFRLLTFLAFGLALNAMPAAAEVVCQPSEQQFYLKGIAWNVETGDARFKYFDDTMHSGRVVYSQPHNEFGEKINMLIPMEPDEIFRRDHVELIAFPINNTGDYQVTGAAFITVDGERRIDHLTGSSSYSCIEM